MKAKATASGTRIMATAAPRGRVSSLNDTRTRRRGRLRTGSREAILNPLRRGSLLALAKQHLAVANAIEGTWPADVVAQSHSERSAAAPGATEHCHKMQKSLDTPFATRCSKKAKSWRNGHKMGPSGATRQQGLTGGVGGRELVHNTRVQPLVCAVSPANTLATPIPLRLTVPPTPSCRICTKPAAHALPGRGVLLAFCQHPAYEIWWGSQHKHNGPLYAATVPALTSCAHRSRWRPPAITPTRVGGWGR